MQKIMTKLAGMQLVGITVRTNNAAEMNPETAQIGPVYQEFFGQKLQDKILHRKTPGTVFAVYTNYESDFTGDYTFFLGEEVTSFADQAEEFEKLIVASQDYAKFTSEPGQMPKVVIDMWQKIWQMSAADLGGERTYVADFEVYDEQSADPQNAIVDIYIGIKK